jgi:hypothetical protein
MFTQLLSELNWLHVVVAAVAFFVLGAVWYSPVLFSKPWAKLVNINMTDRNARKGMGGMMLGSFVLMTVCCIALAIMFSIIHVGDAMGAVKFGLFFGVGFALTAVSISFIYERKPLALYAIDIGYLILGIVIASLVLVLWK